MNYQYTVEKVEHGMLVRGSVPIAEFATLCQLWATQGLDTVALGVASALGCTFAVCAKKDIAAWEASVSQTAINTAGDDAELAWLLGVDTGTSSKTIFSVLSLNHGRRGVPRYGGSVPSDPSDFGRCHRLLELMAGWRERLPEVAAKYPAWVGLVREWDTLAALHEKGDWKQLFDVMQPLIDEGRIADGWIQTGKGSWSKKRAD